MLPSLIPILPSNRIVRINLGLFAIFLAGFIIGSAQSQTSAPAPPRISILELNKPIEREISGAEQHIFQINISANQFASVKIHRLGMDVIVRQIDDAGQTIAQYDIEPGTDGSLILELTSKITGNIKLLVEPRTKSAAPGGRYEITLIELRSATEKENAFNEAAKLLTEANRLWKRRKYDEALPLAEQTLEILEKAFGADDDNVSQVLVTIANIYGDKGDLNKAESFYLRALTIKENLPEKDDISISDVLNNLGLLYKDRGDYVRAESFFQRTLKLREKRLKPDDPLMAGVLNNLANLSKTKGDYVKAVSLYQRVLRIFEKAGESDSPEAATTLNNIAGLSTDTAQAEQIFTRALSIREKRFGSDSPEVAQTLYNMAILYSNDGDFAKAEPLCQHALSIFESRLGAEHPLVSYPLNLLAAIARRNGNLSKSEQLYNRVIAIKEKTQGSFHPDLAGVYANLANLYIVKNEINKAIAAQTRANSIYEYNLALNLTTGSEREKLSYARKLWLNQNQTLSLNFQSAPDSPLAVNLAATTVLQRKGRVIDAMSDSLGILRRRFNKEDQALIDGLNDTTTKLGGLILNEPDKRPAEEYREQIEKLEERRENLESQISRASLGSYEQIKPVTLKAVQEAIPAGAALIEFVVYVPISPQSFEFRSEKKLDIEKNGGLRYAAFVINSQGDVKAKDLGPTKEIDPAIFAYRQALHDPKRDDIRQIARTVDEKLMRPVRALIGNSTQLLISPEGELNLIPFEALVDEQEHYLVEKFSFTYLTSGRDLLRMQTKRESKSKFLIVANPFFGDQTAEKSNTNNKRKTISGNRRTQSITSARNLSGTYFAPLDGTAQEARAIQEIFPEAESLTGNQATESSIKQVTAPRILHIATHGFFLQEAEVYGKNNSPAATRNNSATVTETENPLLRSGLALTGANRRTTTGDDGILTALEASGLNLWGTKLVVLSACDTGLGEIKNGEGVFGLRRAFALAGTETLMMSLWSVSDYVTRELMSNFYKNLKQGMGREAALRQVQLEMLKKPGRQHPFYWASFIQSGEWGNLEGKR